MSEIRKFKAVVIGSGAGGAPAAAALAEKWGDGVAILEAGQHLKVADFTQIEREMIPRLYAGRGTQGTEDGSLSILQGQAVGGSTVINDALCFKPPPEIETRWKAYGVQLSMRELEPLVAEVEAAMSVTEIPRSMINRANYLVGLGAARLGWKGERLRHNSPSCVQCGFRHIGCAYNAKQSMNLTFVPRAVRAGAQLLEGTRAEAIHRVADVWQVRVGHRLIEAEHVVLAAGVVQTPTLLLRSGIHAGENVQVHLQTPVWGDFDDPVDGFNGIPMSYGVLEFADIYGHTGPGYLMEGVSVQPLSFSVQPQTQGAAHEAILKRYRHMAGVVMLLRSRARGTISPGPDSRPKIEYPLVPEDATRIAHFYQRAVELFRAAGAPRVLLSHRERRYVTEPPTDLRIDPGCFYLYTAHPFGGACRGTTCDGEGRVRGHRNLWVLDGSAIPEALGVNPQITIAALALQGARRLIAEA
jgi:choline dehydrogenase-like flavoprotein